MNKQNLLSFGLFEQMDAYSRERTFFVHIFKAMKKLFFCLCLQEIQVDFAAVYKISI